MKSRVEWCFVVAVGHRIEAIARAPLWTAGLDYRHGTGHGVGSFLCVHEGICNRRKLSANFSVKKFPNKKFRAPSSTKQSAKKWFSSSSHH